MKLTPQDLKTIIQLIQRVDIKGSDSIQVAQLLVKINDILTKLTNPSEPEVEVEKTKEQKKDGDKNK